MEEVEKIRLYLGDGLLAPVRLGVYFYKLSGLSKCRPNDHSAYVSGGSPIPTPIITAQTASFAPESS